MAVAPRDATRIITITMTPSLATRDGPLGSFPFEKAQPAFGRSNIVLSSTKFPLKNRGSARHGGGKASHLN